jgi:hypothetical protein
MTTPCLTLPGYVVSAMTDLGAVDVPDGDICGILKTASAWRSHGSQSAGPPKDALAAVQQVLSSNKGADVEAFGKAATSPNSPIANLADASAGAKLVGAGAIIGAGILGTLMIFDIGQITLMLVEIGQAIAAAFVTFGGSLLEILGIKEVSSAALRVGVNTAVTQII